MSKFRLKWENCAQSSRFALIDAANLVLDKSTGQHWIYWIMMCLWNIPLTRNIKQFCCEPQEATKKIMPRKYFLLVMGHIFYYFKVVRMKCLDVAFSVGQTVYGSYSVFQYVCPPTQDVCLRSYIEIDNFKLNNSRI